MGQEGITIVVAVNNMEVLNKNLLISPDIKKDGTNQIIIKQNYPSASLAYNDAIDEAKHEIIIFVHQDVYLPEQWATNLKQAISYFKKEKINWGVLGCFGSRGGATGGIGRVYTNGMGFHGRMINKPEPVQTLDEIVLVIQKSCGLRFDPTLPHFHLYGTDICMSAIEKGTTAYVIPAFCIHNTNQILSLPKEFIECYKHIKRRWGKYLPIYASCVKVSRYDGELHLRQVREFYTRLRRKETNPADRVEDPRSLLSSISDEWPSLM